MYPQETFQCYTNIIDDILQNRRKQALHTATSCMVFKSEIHSFCIMVKEIRLQIFLLSQPCDVAATLFDDVY